ncbi:MAG: FtsQ-type POTRA domain-containing protein [Actinomycetota bacterium]|nr:FtsQ-type POTRA domain-containing protein [Actinomycetota bacterium]
MNPVTVARRVIKRVKAFRMPKPDARWLPRSRAGRTFTALLVIATVGALVWSGSRSALFDVDHIDVAGAFLVSPAEAAEAAGPLQRVALAEVDTTAAAQRVEELPFVRSARVERVFPNRVRIRLTERMPAAFATRPAGGFALLDDSGRVLADRPDRPSDLLEVTGAGHIPPPGDWLGAARPALAVHLALTEPLRRRVSVAVVDGGSVTLRVGNRDVRFGPPEHLDAKVAALAALLDHLGDRPVVAVDVRVPSAPVVVPVALPAGAQPAVAAAPGPRD